MMLKKDPNCNFDPFSSKLDKKHKQYKKWMKFKSYVNKKCAAISDIRDKRVHFETLTVKSVKRNINKICKGLFKSQSSGYEKFLSDEEKRLNLTTDLSLVEGVFKSTYY